MESLIGKTLGPYQILSEIGRGGMAVVYQAYQPALGRHVALKILPPYFAHEPEFVQRFTREAQSAARLKHPHIVIIHDVGAFNGYHFIVMEYLAGLNLKALLERGGALAEARAWRLLAQVADALDYAHGRGFVHRDVKPSNIIVDENDHATLTDFGIAKATEGTRLTRTGALIGTPEYMSPEQARAEPLDARSDLYSLGVVAYEMLTGRVPFHGDTPHVILHQVIYQTPPPLRSVRPTLSASSARTIERALEKDPRARFASANEMARHATARASVPLSPAQPPSSQIPPTRRAQSTSRFPVLPLGIGVLIAGLVLVVVLLATNASRGDVSPTPSAVQPTGAPIFNAVRVDSTNKKLFDLTPLSPGKAVTIRLHSSQRARVADVFYYLANDTPATIASYFSPRADCNEGVLIGTKELTANGETIWPRLVWLHAQSEIWVEGEFCVTLQSSPGSRVSIAAPLGDTEYVIVNLSVE